MATAGDDPLDGLSKEARDAAKALGDLAKAASAAKAPLSGVGDGAKKAGDEADEAARKTAVLTTALGNLAANGLERAGEALAGFLGDLPEAAARSEANARALELLGDAYGAVRQATNGTVSAQQAAAVQQRALQSGLRLSAQELAAVTARARDFARTTGTDVNQALEQLTDQLIDPGEELRKFGVFLQTGMSAGDALRETLRQLGAQASATGAAQVSLAESMDMAKRATSEATDSIAEMIAKRLELRDFFVQYASWVNDARESTSGWRVTLDALLGTLQEVGSGQARLGAAQNQSASGAFVEQAADIAASLRGRGVNLGVDINRFAVQATPRQRDEMLQIMRRTLEATTAERAVAGTRGVGGAAVQEYVDPRRAGSASTPDAQAAARRLSAQAQSLAGTARVGFEEQQRADAAAAAAAARARQEELNRRNRAGQSASSTTSPDTTASWFRNQADQQGFNAWGEMFRRERERAAAERGGSVAQRLAGVDLQRQSSAATNELDIAGMSRGGILGGALSRSAGEAETRQRADRARVIREQREALASLLVEAQREEDIARRMGRPVAEVNGLIQQRIGIQTALAQSTRDLVAAQEEQASGFSIVGEKLIGTLEGTADAFAESVVAALEGSKGFTEAVEEMVRGTLRALAKLAIVEALKEGAMAIAAAATYRYDAAAQHGIAAGMWAGVGILAGAGVAAMGTPKPAGSAGASASPSSGRSASPDRQARADERSGGGPLVMNVVVNGALMTQDEVHHAVGVAVRGAAASGHLAPGLFGGS